MIHVCVALVLYGESEHALEVLSALKAQELDEGTDISVVVVDNGIPHAMAQQILDNCGSAILYLKNRENLGFSAAVNQCLAEARKYGAQYLLLLNPDLLLETIALREMLRYAAKDSEMAILSPKLIRAQPDLQPTSPALLDACGMIMTKSLRHLDRGSGQRDAGQYAKTEQVFGGTGACLLLRISAIMDLCLPRGPYEKSVWQIYPQLEQGSRERPQLLDEAFFAYREDADLAWRAQIHAKKTVYCPDAVGYHVRRVTPEVREKLAPQINLWSVRNRFLLQLNNLKPFSLPGVIFPGLIVRNLMVILAVLVKERSSLPGLLQVLRLLRRALYNRRFTFRDRSASYSRLAKWFI